ncbi:MAG: hypothetical protein S4CHLAM102_06810 [Chlamydiia bacterium]|nr:hypothetical protein [Chlamydiia bacterium]
MGEGGYCQERGGRSDGAGMMELEQGLNGNGITWYNSWLFHSI